MESTKIINGLCNFSYKRCLQELEFISLVQRRLQGQLIETYKYLNGTFYSSHCGPRFQLFSNYILSQRSGGGINLVVVGGGINLVVVVGGINLVVGGGGINLVVVVGGINLVVGGGGINLVVVVGGINLLVVDCNTNFVLRI
ncbi:hypothetical protein FHG87_012717 [Trinorchestia longiramus]|nr:hypothetical protein FHG87_012717 [Trinorchestia longiramus]